jgi:hypothetical protein
MSRKRLSIEERVLKALSRYPFSGGMAEGQLANYVQLQVRSLAFQETMTRLEEQGAVTAKWAPWGRSRRFELVTKDKDVIL